MEESTTKGSYEPECPMAHDLVNRLSALIGHCDLMIDAVSGDSKLLKNLSVIRNIANGMAKELNEFQCELVNARIANHNKTSLA